MGVKRRLVRKTHGRRCLLLLGIAESGRFCFEHPEQVLLYPLWHFYLGTKRSDENSPIFSFLKPVTSWHQLFTKSEKWAKSQTLAPCQSAKTTFIIFDLIDNKTSLIKLQFLILILDFAWILQKLWRLPFSTNLKIQKPNSNCSPHNFCSIHKLWGPSSGINRTRNIVFTTSYISYNYVMLMS